MDFIISAVSDIGTTKQTNQDSCNVRILNTPQGKMVFAVLCDGMGGLEKGEVASASLVNAFCRWSEERLPYLCQSEISEIEIQKEWTDIALLFNEKISNYTKQQGISMGTTINAVLLTSKNYFILNVGDSRTYEISDSLYLLTHDQTLVAREVELGNISPEQAKSDPRRSVLLQCIGASDEVYPEFVFGEIKRPSVFMICSDGFRHEITDSEIYAYLNPDSVFEANDIKNNLRYLTDLNKERMERDNITAIAIKAI